MLSRNGKCNSDNKDGKDRKPNKSGNINKNKVSETDPLGSYTGRPEGDNDVPTQDADDL